jgi:hypothetical protein
MLDVVTVLPLPEPSGRPAPLRDPPRLGVMGLVCKIRRFSGVFFYLLDYLVIGEPDYPVQLFALIAQESFKEVLFCHYFCALHHLLFPPILECPKKCLITPFHFNVSNPVCVRPYPIALTQFRLVFQRATRECKCFGLFHCDLFHGGKAGISPRRLDLSCIIPVVEPLEKFNFLLFAECLHRLIHGLVHCWKDFCDQCFGAGHQDDLVGGGVGHARKLPADLIPVNVFFQLFSQ